MHNLGSTYSVPRLVILNNYLIFGGQKNIKKISLWRLKASKVRSQAFLYYPLLRQEDRTIQLNTIQDLLYIYANSL